MKAFFERNSGYFLFVFRIIVGILFFMHGFMKWGAVSSFSFNLMFFAGIIEMVGSILIILGLFVRYTAIITAVEMLVAYFIAHIPNGLSPLANKGEPALLFFASFLVLMSLGPGKFALGKED